jgi:Uma2 family endonuclease
MDEVDKSIHHHLAVQFKAPLLILELLSPKAKQRRKKNTPSKMLTRSMMRHGMKLRPRK